MVETLWKGRGLTIYDRTQIINSLLLPKLIYISSMFPVLEDVIREANRIIFKFLWKGRDRVKRNAVLNTYENGGLKVLDIETMVRSLRLTWLRSRLYSGEDAGWKSYLRLLLKGYGGDFLCQYDYDPKDYDISNKFYSELVQFWEEFRNAFSEEDGKRLLYG